MDIQDASDFHTTSEKMINRMPAEPFTLFSAILFLIHRKRFFGFVNKHRPPAVYDDRKFALESRLISYTTNHLHLYRRAATYVDQILKGAKSGNLPVEETMQIEFIINLQAAKKIGFEIPAEVMQRADKVIK